MGTDGLSGEPFYRTLSELACLDLFFFAFNLPLHTIPEVLSVDSFPLSLAVDPDGGRSTGAMYGVLSNFFIYMGKEKTLANQ